MTSRLALKFGIVGITIGAAVVLLWWFVRISDPFHFPTVGQTPPNYTEPLLLTILDDSVFVLCPGSLLQVFTLEMRGWLAWFMWILAVLLNGPIYYAIGLLVGILPRREKTKGVRAKGA
jgi:hypothetical protein